MMEEIKKNVKIWNKRIRRRRMKDKSNNVWNIIQSMNDIIIDSVKNVLGFLTKSFGTLFSEHTKKTNFLEFFKHNIDMVGIDEKFSINIKPKKIKDQVDEELYVIALNMKIEKIYGKRYKEKVIILLQKK